MRKRIVISLFLISFACISIVVINRFSILSAECIPPDVATIPANMYEVRPKRETSFFTAAETIPLSWSIQPNWLQPFQREMKPAEFPFINAIAVRNGIVWVSLLSQILRYNNITGVSDLYQILDENQEVFVIRDIFFTRDGNLWALVATNQKSNSVAVARYNPQTNQFDIVPKLFNKEDKGDTFFKSPHILAETTDGKLLVPLAHNIVLYDVRQNTVLFLLPSDFPRYMYVSGMAVFGNKVWFTVGWFTVTNRQDVMDLRSVDLQTGELINYGHILGMLDDPAWRFSNQESYRSLTIDRQGNVWVGSLSQLKLDPDGKYVWQKVVPPPEFVYETDANPYQDNENRFKYVYQWADVFSVNHYSDDNIWFDTTRGLVQYNPKKNKWCKSITTGWDNPHLNIYKHKLIP